MFLTTPLKVTGICADLVGFFFIGGGGSVCVCRGEGLSFSSTKKSGLYRFQVYERLMRFFFFFLISSKISGHVILDDGNPSDW